MWQDRNADVRVAGTTALERGTLVPAAAFHPKFYVFDRPDGTVGSLVTSANLTNRGLTINSEVGWREDRADAAATDEAWRTAVELAVPLTDGILQRYAEHRKSTPDRVGGDDMARVPPPSQTEQLAAFVAASDPASHSQLWVQSFGMSGGSQTQLELPRGAHQFFGVAQVDYGTDHVGRITEPTLVAGDRVWNSCQLRWHGNNRMERINLPSRAKGGFPNYAHSLILFRRLSPSTYELHVHPWESDTARAYREASRQHQLLFRVGTTNTGRLAGLLG